MNTSTLSMDERRAARRAVFENAREEINVRIESRRALTTTHQEEHAKRMEFFAKNNAEKALYE